MGQIKFLGSLIMIAIFSLSLILFAIGFGIDNDAAVNLQDSAGYSNVVDNSKDNLSTWRTQVITSSSSFYNSSIGEGSETLTTGGQFKLGPATALSTSTGLLGTAFTSVFGSGTEFAWVLTAFGAFLGLVLTLLIWKTWGGRNPE